MRILIGSGLVAAAIGCFVICRTFIYVCDLIANADLYEDSVS